MTTERERVLEDIARKQGVMEPKVVSSNGNPKGDGYMGEMSFVDVVGKNRTIKLIFKAAPKGKVLREKAFIRETFTNEILFYKEIYPIFTKLQDEKNIEEPFNAVAKCYKTNSEEFEEYLVFENLNASGFTMWNRKVAMDKEHVVRVFREYAKVHAFSFVLKDQQPETFAKILANTVDIMDKYANDDAKFDAFVLIANKLRAKVDEAFKDEKISAAFSKLCDEMKPLFREQVVNDDCVLLHGDCWCNNMLFKYKDDDSKTLCDMKLIDWQLIRYGLPIWDLSYFLYTCSSKDVYDDLDGLLRIYHHTMKEHARKLGTHRIITFTALKEYWRKYGKAGLVMTFITMKIMLSESEEAPDLSKSAESGGEIIDAFDFESKNDDMYHSRLFDVILHCYNNGFI